MNHELQRIANIPREAWNPTEWNALEAPLRRPGCSVDLFEIQKRSLLQIARCTGGNIYLGIGRGKSYVALLSGAVLRASRVLVFTEGSARDGARAQMDEQLRFLSTQYYLQPTRVCSYSELSIKRSAYMLENEYQQHAGRIVIAFDECHNLRALDKGGRPSTRTSRVYEFAHKHPEVPIIMLTGTPFGEYLVDAAHLAEIATREWSPLPHEGTQVYTSLKNIFAGTPMTGDWNPVASIVTGCLDIETRKQRVAGWFVDKLSDCAGTITDFSEFSDVPLIIHRIYDVNVPDIVRTAKRRFDTGELVPTQEPQLSASSLSVAKRRCESGFYYEWIWPDAPDLEWLFARRGWARQVTRELQDNRAPGYDSELLIAHSVRHAMESRKPRTALERAWCDWTQHLHKPCPDVAPVWISDYLIEHAVALAREHNAIIWYEDRAIAFALAQRMETVFSGQSFSKNFARPIALSRPSHGTGLNLQAWSNAVYLQFPGRPVAWQQSLGRNHRTGQTQPVTAWVYTHAEMHEKAFDRAIERATNLELQSREPQRLLQGLRNTQA